MTPASPSEPSFRNAASTRSPIFTVSGSTSMICDVRRQPSAISTIASTYGFIISYAAGASWITENDTTVPFPFSFTRSIFPKLRRPHSGQTVRGGKSRVLQFPHFEPYRLYRLSISRQRGFLPSRRSRARFRFHGRPRRPLPRLPPPRQPVHDDGARPHDHVQGHEGPELRPRGARHRRQLRGGRRLEDMGPGPRGLPPRLLHLQSLGPPFI